MESGTFSKRHFFGLWKQQRPFLLKGGEVGCVWIVGALALKKLIGDFRPAPRHPQPTSRPASADKMSILFFSWTQERLKFDRWCKHSNEKGVSYQLAARTGEESKDAWDRRLSGRIEGVHWAFRLGNNRQLSSFFNILSAKHRIPVTGIVPLENPFFVFKNKRPWAQRGEMTAFCGSRYGKRGYWSRKSIVIRSKAFIEVSLKLCSLFYVMSSFQNISPKVCAISLWSIGARYQRWWISWPKQ